MHQGIQTESQFRGSPLLGGLRLSRRQKERIHQSALAVLQKVGLKVACAEAVELFHGGGAAVDIKSGESLVRLKPSLVEDCIDQTPKDATYYGRIPEHDFKPRAGKVVFAAFGQCVNILDPATGGRRASTKNDMAASARLQDALPHLSTIARTLSPGDCLPEAHALHCMDAIIRNSAKHISGGAADKRSLDMIIQMMETAAGGKTIFKERPFYSPSFCPTSPLTFGRDGCEVAICAARCGLPTVVMIMPLAGGTAPVHLMGTLVQGLAEQLGGLVLTQLARRHSPITLGSAATIMDLKTGIGAMGAPESGMINGCLAQMAAFYNLPSRVACGVSDACLPDAQIGYEFCLNAFSAALAGAAIVFAGGALESGLTHSPAKLLLDHEMMGHIRQMVSRAPFDDLDVALSEISEIGPGNSYLMHPHTMAGMRAQSRGSLFNRNPRETWLERTTGKTADQLADKSALNIIERHHPVPLAPGVEAQIAEMLREFEARLGAAKR